MGYGYRLYLDDLPSATIINGQPEYGSTIPLGYIKGGKQKVNLDYDGMIKDINVFNFLNITVLVHDTPQSKMIGNYDVDGNKSIHVEYGDN